MTHIRRIVTGHDSNGHSIIAADGMSPHGGASTHLPGYSVSVLWATPADGSLPTRPTDVTPDISVLPERGETRFVTVTFPPDSVAASPDFNAEAFAAELRQLIPGLADKMEHDDPGMHRTQSVDYVFVLSGEVWLELDNGNETRLQAGDVVVQNGTRHAWRNKSNQNASILCTLIGK